MIEDIIIMLSCSIYLVGQSLTFWHQSWEVSVCSCMCVIGCISCVCACVCVHQDAAKRCKMEFLSRSDDKKLRWIITESCPQPHLIDEKQLPDQDEEVKGDIEVKEDDEVKSEDDTPPKESKETNQKEADSVGDEATIDEIEEERPVAAKPARGRGGWRGRRGRGRGDRGAILLTSLEQEMLLWALGGFLPVGPEGLKPSPEHQVSKVTIIATYNRIICYLG